MCFNQMELYFLNFIYCSIIQFILTVAFPSSTPLSPPYFSSHRIHTP